MMVSSDKMQLWGGVMTQRVGGYMANDYLITMIE